MELGSRVTRLPILIFFATALALGPASPVGATTSTATTGNPERNEHVTASPAGRAPVRFASQEPSATQLTAASRLRFATTSGPRTSSGLQFLTRPYVVWHTITSVFDHCNPDYSTDGKVCRFDGSVGYKSYGVDPSFSRGYAQTPGGSDYLYYDGHNGWDYSMNYENVYAAADGTVQLAGSDSVNPCFGQTIILNHPNGYSTRYAHLSAIYVSPGQSIERGQVIAQSGNTGCSSGPHLHFGVYITSSWTAVDPWGWWGAAGADPWPSDPGDLWLTGSGQFPIPWAPTSVTAVPGNGSAGISWTAPGFDGGTGIANYIVTASPSSASVTVPGSVTTATVPGLTDGLSYSFTVTAVNRVGAGPVSSPSNAVVPHAFKGMYTLDGYGGLHADGGSAAPSASAYWPSTPLARSAAMLPGTPVGYVLDAFGGLHPFGSGASGPPAAIAGATSWPGWDIARDVALLPTATGAAPLGYTLDGFGGLHAFGGAPAVRTSAYWQNWDIAKRVVVLSDGTGGYVMDGWGGLHPFAVGGNTMPPAVAASGYWPGQTIARDIALLPGATAAHVAGLTLDGFGGVHPFGEAQAVSGATAWPNFDIARAVRLSPDSTSSHPAGWVLDGWGGLHPFGGAPAVTAGAYWQNWDVAVQLVIQ